MTLELTGHDPNHVGELTLRRFRAGELGRLESERLEARLANEPALQARLEQLAKEEAAFRSDISFERFAGGVERARRTLVRERQMANARVLRTSLWTTGGLMAAAAAFLLFILPSAPRVLEKAPQISLPGTGVRARPSARTKGAAPAIVVRIAADDGRGPQREAAALERLDPGDRLRIGYRTPSATDESGLAEIHYLVALTIDEAGEVTPLYPEIGQGVAVEPGAKPRFLPDSFAFTGKGKERLVVFLSAAPLTVDAARARVVAAFASASGALDGQAFAAAALARAPDETVQTYLFEKP